MTVTLQRYKRFEEVTQIDVSADVVALVGPNEAGKSSILQAMISLNNREPIPERDQTRGTAGETQVIAGYVLDDEDREAIADVTGGSGVQWWTYTRHQNGNAIYSLHPTPRRDLSERQELLELLRRFYAEGEIEKLIKAVGDRNNALEFYKDAAKALATKSQSLEEEDFDTIQLFGKLHGLVAPVSVEDESSDNVDGEISREFYEYLRRLASYNEGDHPHHVAALRLIDRRPEFLLFNEEDRALLSTYDLAHVLSSIPPALFNLSRLANVDLRALRDAATRPDRGKRAELLDKANTELRKVFRKAWRQTDLSVRLDMDGTLLTVLVERQGGGYTELEERSAGLRSFVALRAFLERFDLSVPPILLIDEAETHLHYDAQADLTNVFTEQRFASKVIYTTHSAGCLPRDLGNGIRAVVPAKHQERSVVSNNVWAGRGVGLSPIVFAMGATTFFFLPARHVLLAEGPSDAMLYPTLFREATGLSSLSFQVAPGLANVSPSQIPSLISEGGAVAFITDGDESGFGYCKALEADGVPADL